MSKFNKLYFQQLLNNIQPNWIKNLIILDQTLSPKLPFIFSNNKTIFQQAEYYKKFNNIWKNTIFETPSDYANYGDSILNIINNGNNKQIYTKQEFINLIPKTWIYYNNLLKLKNFKIYIYKFDFADSEPLDHSFSLVDELLQFYDENDFKFTHQSTITSLDKELHKQIFKNITNNSTGCVRPKILIDQNTEGILMFLNLKNFNIKTINHQLFHVFQQLLNIDLFQQSQSLLPILSKQQKKQIFNIGLDEKLLNYYFSIHQFWTNIHNNLIDKLEEIYLTSNLTKSQFIQKIFNDSQNFQIQESDNLLAFLKTIFFLKNKLSCFNNIIKILTDHFS